MKEQFDNIDTKIDTLLNKHLNHIHEELTGMHIVITAVKTDVSWLKKAFGVIFVASAGGLIGQIISLL